MTPEQRKRLLEMTGNWRKAGQCTNHLTGEVMEYGYTKDHYITFLHEAFSQRLAEEIADAVLESWDWTMKHYAKDYGDRRYAAWIDPAYGDFSYLGRGPTRAEAIEAMLAAWLEEQGDE